MTMKRFRVEESSMLPALHPGDEIVASDSTPPAIGDVIVFEHPDREAFWLVKRVVESPVDLPAHQVWVLSDNLGATRSDSRSIGPVSLQGAYRRVERLDHLTFVEACEMLAAEDDVINETLGRQGVPEFWHRPQGFPVLTLLILEQQVSLESGAAMYRRVANAVGSVTPETVSQFGESGLRSIGVTRQKAEYLTGLAATVEEGGIDIEGLDRLSVDEARAALTAMRGIGLWTADAYLLSALRHPDMWPVGDRALQVGTGELLGMSSIPDEEELEIIAEPWRPVRAAAARLIWHSYLTERGRTEPPDPTLARAPNDDA